MDIRITPRPLCGDVNAITSKSAAHRLLICAAFAENGMETELVIDNLSEDIEATINCLTAMGAVIKNKEHTESFIVTPVKISEIYKNTLIDCGESGSTLRFLLPIAALANKNITVTGSGTLFKRPMKELIEVLEHGGACFTSQNLPYTVGGGLKSGVYSLPGNVSSGYISGMMFALPMLSGDSEIVLLSPPQSTGYINMTINALKLFGIEILKNKTGNGWSIKGNQSYKSPSFAETEKDWSNAAFFLAAGAVGNEKITVNGLDNDSAQGDKSIVRFLKKFGAETVVSEGVSVSGGKLKGQKIDVSETPDLLPILAVLGAVAEGETVLYNAARLRLKESDRLASVAELLKSFGFSVAEESDRLIIQGGKRKETTEITIDSRSDHRITMSAAILAGALNTSVREVIIKNAEAANKSYPGFFEDYKKLGGNCNVI